MQSGKSTLLPEDGSGDIKNNAGRAQQNIDSAMKSRLLDAAAEAIFLLDSQGVCLYLNEAAHRLQDLLGHSIHDLQLSGDSITFAEHLHKAFLEGSTFLEIPVQQSDGSDIYLEISARAIEDDGRTFMMAIVRDITDRRAAMTEACAGRKMGGGAQVRIKEEAGINKELQVAVAKREKAIRKLNQEKRLIENSPAVLMRWDVREGWPVRFVTDNIAQFGYDPQDIRSGRVGFRALLHPEDADRVFSEAAACAACGEDSFQQRYQLLTAAGETRCVDARMMVIRDYEGRSLFFHGLIIDVTEYTRLEAEQEGYIAQLKKADRLKSDFISRVSHELRTPLTLIKGYLDLFSAMKLGSLRKRQAAALEVMRKNADRLHNLIDDLLDLSRMESGQMNFSLASVDIGALLLERTEAFRGIFQRRSLYLNCLIEPDLPAVSGDYNRLGQVVDNLLDNAFKFTSMGGVTVSCRRQEDWVRLEVADTGKGLSASDLEHIFDRFYQVEPVLTRVHSGTGLGLAIAREIVEMQNGRIWAESDGRGRGSAFIVMLPSENQALSQPLPAAI